MTLLADRVAQTTSASGNGAALNIDGGAKVGFQTFGAGIGYGVTTYYALVHPTNGQWEIGIGTVTAGAPDVLNRNTILSGSSGAGVRVNFAAGANLDVFQDLPASKVIVADSAGLTTLPGGLVVPVAHPSMKVGVDGALSGGVKIWNAIASAEGNIYGDATYGIRLDTNSNARPIRIDGSALRVSSAATFDTSIISNGTLTVVNSSGVIFGVRGSIAQDGSFNYIFSTNSVGNAFQVNVGGGAISGGPFTVSDILTLFKPNSSLTHVLNRTNNTYGQAFQWQTNGTADWVLGATGTTDSNFHLFNYGTIADALSVARATSDISLASRLAVNGIAIAANVALRVGGTGLTNASYGLDVTNSAGTDNLLVRDDGAILIPRVGTTASAANAFIDNAASNNVLRSTSSRRYKTEIVAYDLERARRILFGSEASLFASTAEADNPERHFVGFIAEQIWSIKGEGKRYVHLDEKGRPESVAYASYVVPLTVIAQDHEERIRQLEKRRAA